MKTKNLLSILLILIALTTNGCNVFGSGNLITENRKVETFSAIDLQGVANVYLTQGDVQEVKVEADDNLIGDVTTEVKGGKLVIGQKRDVVSKATINVYITVKELCQIDLSGSGNISMRSQFNCDFMNVNLSGSGDVHAIVAALNLKAILSGSGNVDFKGRADKTDIRIDGSGNVDGKGMTTNASTVQISGAGNCIIDAKDELTVSITGVGNVNYLSEPAKLNQTVSGVGKVGKL
jgi:hypothetical protein